MGYMYNPKNEMFARARVEDVNASFKDLGAVCDSVRGMKALDAIEMLEMAVKGRIPILYRRHNKKMGHRRELGGKKGRWPMKEARIILKLVKSAVANAEQKGLIDEDLVITHIAANKQRTYARVAPRGRWRRAFYENAFAEVVVEEVSFDDSGKGKAKNVKEKKVSSVKKKQGAKEVKKYKTETAQPDKSVNVAKDKGKDREQKSDDKQEDNKTITDNKNDEKKDNNNNSEVKGKGEQKTDDKGGD